MRSYVRARLITYCLCGMFSISLLSDAQAKPEPSDERASFLIEDSLKFAFPNPRNRSNQIIFQVFSKGGPISDVHIAPKPLKSPAGRVRILAPGAIKLADKQVTWQGSQVTINLKPDFFVEPGEYSLLVAFTGKRPDGHPVPNALAKLTLVHTAPNLNIDELKDEAIRIYRICPFIPTSKTVGLSLRETSGLSAIEDLKIQGGPLLAKDSRIRVSSGRVIAKPADVGQVIAAPVNKVNKSAADFGKTAQGTAQTALFSITLQPNQTQQIALAFEDITEAGAFTSQLIASSPSFGSDKTFPINIVVTDYPVLPVAAIWLGVFLGFLASRWVTTRRQQQVNAMRIAALAEQLNQLRGVVLTPGKQAKLRSLYDMLNQSIDNNELDNVADTATQLATVGTALSAFLEAEANQSDSLNKTARQLTDEIQQYLQTAEGLSRADSDLLTSLNAQLTQVQSALQAGEVDRADLMLGPIQNQLQELRLQRLKQDKDRLEQAFQSIREDLQNDPQMRNQMESLLKDAQSQIDQRQPDQATKTLDELRAQLRTVRQRRQLVDHRPEAERLSFPIPNRAPQLVVKPEEAERVSGANLSLMLVNFEEIVKDGDKLQWDFGDRSPFQVDDNPVTHHYQATHRYDRSGRYMVVVTVLRNAAATGEKVQLKILVLPNATEIERNVRRKAIHRGDVMLTIVSLVAATATGYLALYDNKPFGSFQNYLLATLWGLGVDTTLRGFGAISRQIRVGGG